MTKYDAYIRLGFFTVGSLLAAIAWDLTWLQQTALSLLACPLAMPPPQPDVVVLRDGESYEEVEH